MIFDSWIKTPLELYPLRSSDPGSRNHVQDIPTLVHDFRFLDQYAPRIETPFEAHIQDHETMYCPPLHPQWGIPSLLGTRFPINQKKYFDFLQDARIFLVRQIFGISQKVRLTNPIVPNSYLALFPKTTAFAIRRNRKYSHDKFRKVNI